MITIVVILFAVVMIFQIIGYVLSAPVYKGPVSDHFDGKRFINPGNVKAKGFRDAVKWMTSRKRGEWKINQNASIGEKPAEKITEGARVTFVNHSTFLIQTKGYNMITDPVFSERVSPFSFAGPKRMRPPGIRFEDLPTIDIVLLSHNHYDHLDIDTVKKINQKFHPLFIVPLGVAAFLGQHGIEKTHELDWWESAVQNDIHITSTPAQHFSGRGLFDRDATLWCGYVISTSHTNIYFAGDTGYNSHTFKEIGERFSPIDVSLIPVGAYKPIWFMSPIHCSPAEAVQIHLDVKSKKTIATHFGTFPLADEGQDELVNDLNNAKRENKINDKDFIALTEGTYLNID